MLWIWLAGILGLFGQTHALWPQPSEYTHGNKTLWLSPSAQFTYNRDNRSTVYTRTGYSGAGRMFRSWFDVLQYPRDTTQQTLAKPLPSVEQFVEDAIRRTKDAIFASKFVPWKFYPRHQKFEPLVDGQHSTIKQIVINERSMKSRKWFPRNYVNGDESYQIRISEDGVAQISSTSPIGTIRALQTFQQLFYPHTSLVPYTPFAPISISDFPKWQHRGLNLDISRNVFRPEEVKRTIDAMATVKLNRLHIHAADSQSWPLDIPSIPELAVQASYHPSQIWSAAELETVQLYGLERGVSVFLEIDLPGHTAAVGHAFPDLVAAFHKDDWETYAAEPPSGQVKLNSSAVHQFLDRLLADILPRVSPLTEYFHTGGDEFNLNTYLLELNLGSNDRRVLTPLLKKMVTRIHNSLRSSGLSPIVWEELILDWDLNLPSQKTDGETGGVIVQAWRNSSAVKHALQKGYRTIFGSGDAWYLDCGVGTFLNPRPGSKLVQDPYLDWCSPTKNWKHMYVYNPLQDIPAELQHLLIGGETHMWSELVDPVNMDQMIWPRAAAAAEVLWTGPRSPENIKDASYRLAEWRERAVIEVGIRAAMVQMTYCLMRESGCEL
ncbi:beta-hexosaminidase subunit beta [Nannizzia gypsea CBS 118893]|uniref:Beta-hexosaminidase n=1 Tax=Arthroderma gypseum (strain ATCC MYA-4604 / CBS 118893) TaxID=535722 RepID=E4V711_ARTGP|nr:beta-hexosaminidase subunit beta [Nannizzia gypsea CBS 118893]EFQ96877.1 beta-hexosaminidase subunit beta [Nannizzia gypsea CBS 118893]